MTKIEAANIFTKEIKTEWAGICGTKCFPKFIRVFLESSYMKGKWKKGRCGVELWWVEFKRIVRRKMMAWDFV